MLLFLWLRRAPLHARLEAVRVFPSAMLPDSAVCHSSAHDSTVEHALHTIERGALSATHSAPTHRTLVHGRGRRYSGTLLTPHSLHACWQTRITDHNSRRDGFLAAAVRPSPLVRAVGGAHLPSHGLPAARIRAIHAAATQCSGGGGASIACISNLVRCLRHSLRQRAAHADPRDRGRAARQRESMDRRVLGQMSDTHTGTQDADEMALTTHAGALLVSLVSHPLSRSSLCSSRCVDCVLCCQTLKRCR